MCLWVVRHFPPNSSRQRARRVLTVLRAKTGIGGRATTVKGVRCYTMGPGIKSLLAQDSVVGGLTTEIVSWDQRTLG
jgi:hypothetical protein